MKGRCYMSNVFNNEVINIKLDVIGVNVNDFCYLSLKDLVSCINYCNDIKMVKVWMNNKNVLERNIVWEVNHNSYFDSLKLCKLKDNNQKNNSLFLTPRLWIKEFDGKGFIIIDGDIYIVKDLARDFMKWLTDNYLKEMVGV